MTLACSGLRWMPSLLLLMALSAAAQEQQQQAKPKLHELCGACHTEPASDFQEHPHFAKGLQCDACHGESKAHREATGHKPPDKIAGPGEQPAVCGACHASQRKAYEASKHWQLVASRAEKRSAACTTCHGTHSPRSPAAITAQCNRCHAELPAACRKDPPAAAVSASRVACAGCHEKHIFVLKR